MMILNAKQRWGFTLIELLVVLGVVSLLVAILLPSLNKAREQGQRAVCQGNLRQLAFAHGLYQADSDGRVVPAIQEETAYSYWYNTMGGYFSHERIDALDELIDGAGRKNLRCPRDRSAYPTLLNPHGESPNGWLSYALNSQPTQQMSTGLKSYAGIGGNRIFAIRRPAEVLLHVDFAYRAWICDALTLMRHQYTSELGAHFDSLPGYPQQDKAVANAYRHHGRMNVLWSDGHVSLLKDQIPAASERPAFWGPVYNRLPRKTALAAGK
jgi:prepilin-type N-terminal cleavage/methylation domain-containing protein/prepilin-type processing-associated H-X9-DG protein